MKPPLFPERRAYTANYQLSDPESALYAEVTDYVKEDASARQTRYSAKSVPCFEYWVLLHFRNHTAPYARCRDRSPCDCCYRDVKHEWPDYAKNSKRLFEQLQPRVNNAKRHAEHRLAAATEDGSDNPSTEIHRLLEVVETLTHLRSFAIAKSLIFTFFSKGS